MLATVILTLVLIAVVAAILGTWIRNKKHHKGGCADCGACSGCAGCSAGQSGCPSNPDRPDNSH
ncbi:MAG: FeoB-associated Cys-rich membrane protein [Oscillospiraceae bacterium]|nr:FeoB-associated Cys-rich membrane protein [Oscillospiraceae bacterium]